MCNEIQKLIEEEREDAKNQGIIEGKNQGIIEGKCYVVKKLFKMNMPFETIKELTDLTDEQLNECLS